MIKPKIADYPKKIKDNVHSQNHNYYYQNADYSFAFRNNFNKKINRLNRLDRETVAKIKKAKGTLEIIAKKFNVHKSTVSRIKNERTHKRKVSSYK